MEQAPALPKFSLLPGWICLAVATVSMPLMGPFLGSIIAGPLTLAALILSIIGMVRNNVVGGILLMVLTFILPGISLIVSLGMAFVLPAMKQSSKSPATPPAIESTAQ
jgi:hypothetical protein